MLICVRAGGQPHVDSLRRLNPISVVQLIQDDWRRVLQEL